MTADEKMNTAQSTGASLSCTSNEQRARVRLSGPQTIAQAQATHADLARALSTAEATDIEIDCADVTEADLAFLQLLIATVEGARLSGHAVTLSGPAQGAVAEALVKAGLSHPAGPDHGWLNPFWAGQRTTP